MVARASTATTISTGILPSQQPTLGSDPIPAPTIPLVLAYAGAALPLLLLFSIAQSGVGTVANSELVAEEIVRTLVGSIGLVASVPVTTALAALVVSADRRRPQTETATAGAVAAAGAAAGQRLVRWRTEESWH